MNWGRAGLLFVLLSASTSAHALTFSLVNRFEAPTPTSGDQFGTSVALEGNVAAIKSDSGYIDGDDISTTHVFESDASGRWSHSAAFDFSSRNSGNPFIGQELAIDGGEIVVGFGPEFTQTSGVALQFLSRDATGWNRQLSSNNPFARPRLAGIGPRTAGRTVDISGDWAIAEEAGAPRGAGRQGVARVYNRQPTGEWLEVTNLFPESGITISAAAAALDGTTAALVDRSPGLFQEPGGLYFFERQPTGEWIQTESFFQPQDEDGFFFRIVEIDGDVAVTRDINSGLLTIYERIGGVGQEVDELDLPIQGIGASFALDEGLIAYSSGSPDEDPYHVGLLRRSTTGEWQQAGIIENPEPELGLPFGASLAIDGGRVLVGAMNVFDIATDFPAGAAYLFAPVPEPVGGLLASTAIAVVAALRGQRFEVNAAFSNGAGECDG